MPRPFVVPLLLAAAAAAPSQTLGPFVAREALSAAGAASSLRAGDLDADGRADVAYADVSGFRVSISNPNGTPRPPTAAPIAGGGLIAALADLYGDGSADVLAIGANLFGVRLAATTTQPGGPPSFTTLLLPLVNSVPVVGVAASGGFPVGATKVVHVLRTGTGGFPILSTFDVGGSQAAPTAVLRPGAGPALPTGATGIAVGNFDGDGRADLVVVGAALSSVYAIYLDATGVLLPNAAQPVVSPGGLNSSVPVVADFDGDGLDDFAAGGLLLAGVALNQGVAPGAAGPTFATGSVPGSSGWVPFGAGDVDGDGDVDVACRAGAAVRFLLNDGFGGFVASPSAAPFLAGAGIRLAAADADADGDVDFVTASSVAGSIVAFATEINQAHPSFVERPGTTDGVGFGAQTVPPGAPFAPTGFGAGPLFDVGHAPLGAFDLWFAASFPPSFTGATYLLSVDAFLTGFPPPPFLPSVYLSAAFVPLQIGVVPASGVVVYGPLPLPPLPTGLSGLAQVAVVTQNAANGLYATSDAFELQW